MLDRFKQRAHHGQSEASAFTTAPALLILHLLRPHWRTLLLGFVTELPNLEENLPAVDPVRYNTVGSMTSVLDAKQHEQ